MKIYSLLIRDSDNGNEIFMATSYAKLIEKLREQHDSIKAEQLPDTWRQIEKIAYIVEHQNRMLMCIDILKAVGSLPPGKFTNVFRKDNIYVKKAMMDHMISWLPELTLLVRDIN